MALTPRPFFWYNKKMRGFHRGIAGFCLAALASFLSPALAAQTVEDLFQRLQTAFAARDTTAYLDAFDPALRAREAGQSATFRDAWKMETVAFHLANRDANPEGEAGLYFQALYENPFAVMLEIWHVGLRRDGGRWIISAKELSGNITTLYKVKIPSGRAERAARVEIRHQDIVLTFQDAWVFYDNIPDMETALLVIGKGRIRFTPSDEGERHQLELRYKTKAVEDVLEYAFLRFSDAFFRSNITIIPADAVVPGKSLAPASAGGQGKSLAPADAGGPAKTQVPAPPGPSQAMTNRAYSLFSKFYPLAFTIENSLTRDRLSFIPQTDQVTFDFKGAAKGDMGYIFSPFSDEEVHFLTRNPDRLINLYSPETETAGGLKKMFVSFGEKYDVQRCDVELDFQPERFYLSARARIQVLAQVDAVDSLKFSFNAKLDILRIFDQDNRELFFTQDKGRNLLYIYMLKPIERRATATIEVLYRGSLEPMIQTADVLPSRQTTDSYSFVLPRFETFLYSQGSAWYPAPPEDDYFQASLRFSVPPGYTCVANGVLTEQGVFDSRRVSGLDKVGNLIFRFETKSPVKYLSVLFGKLDRLPDPSGPTSVPLQVFASADIGASRLWIAEESRAILGRYESWFGAFPFEKLTVVQRLHPTAGGHSPASFVVLNEVPRSPDILPPPVLGSPVDLSRYREYFLAHEMAHQWWGQAVAGERYRDQWLSEGLAQFAAVSYLRAKWGEAASAAIMKKFSQWTERKSRYGGITLGSRLSYLDFEAYQAIVYDKTAIALSMLRDLLGEEVFFRGLKTFFETYKFKPARTPQFVKVMETVSGRGLKAFFDGWFESYALPDVRVTSSAQKGSDGYVLKIWVTQNRGVFVFPLWVTWEENGRKVRRMLEVNSAAREYEIRTSAWPARVRVNPDKIVPGDFR
jgi:hypothetical protein